MCFVKMKLDLLTIGVTRKAHRAHGGTIPESAEAPEALERRLAGGGDHARELKPTMGTTDLIEDSL